MEVNEEETHGVGSACPQDQAGEIPENQFKGLPKETHMKRTNGAILLQKAF